MHTIYEAVTAFLEEGCHCLIDGVHYTTATKLELPALGDGERKKVKEKLAEGYPEIKCKSGLHLFKVDEKTKVEESLTQFLSEGSTVVPGASPEDEQDLPTVEVARVTWATPADQVRNTFIHFEGGTEVVDQRAVQSMPHSMFSQCVKDETGKEKAVEKESFSAQQGADGDKAGNQRRLDTDTTATTQNLEKGNAHHL